MITTEPIEALMRALARAVARGRSVASWAKPHQISVEIARDWSERPEFRTLVEEDRISVTDRMVGKLARISSRAIDRLVELSERSGQTGVSVSATRALFKCWIDVSNQLEIQKKMESMNARVKMLEKNKSAVGRVSR